MKKLTAIFFILSLLLLSCTASDTADDPKDMYDLLKINTYLLDADLEGTGRWGYIGYKEKTPPYKPDGDGYWIPDDDTTQVANEDVFVYEALQPGEVRTMAPMGLHLSGDSGKRIGYSNLILDIEFEGMVKVKKVEPADSSIRLVAFDTHGWTDLSEATLSPPCTLNICPVGKIMSTEATQYLVATDTLVDKEYTLEIQGCTLGGQPVVTAVVKITSIPDPEYPWETVHDEQYSELHQKGEERTRFCTIELVSYTYSEMYLMQEGNG